MSTKVLAAVLEKPEKIVLREFDKPDIKPDEGLLKVEMAGVCGSDPNFYRGLRQTPLPIILGHESIGRIAAIGSVASKRWNVKEGDRVITEVFVRCGFCRPCVTGNYRWCENVRYYGRYTTCAEFPHLWGMFAEYTYLAPGAVVHKISDKVLAKAGVLVNGVLSNGIRWGRMTGGYSIGHAVVIQGAGQQGLMQVIAAKESGCSTIVITGLSRDAQRLELARELGAHFTINVEKEDVVQRVTEITSGRMADVVIQATSDPEAVAICLDLVKGAGGGKIVLCGLIGMNRTAPIVQDKIIWKEVEIVGQFGSDSPAIDLAIALVESGKYPIEKVVSHTFSLQEAEKAVKTAGGYFIDTWPTKCVIVP